MTHDELLRLLEIYHKETDDNVIGVGYGYKITNNQLTDEKSIVFTVKSKLPKDQISADKLLPATLTISENVIVSTDVVQDTLKALTCDPNFYTWQTTWPTNRKNTFRPLKGGISISSIPQTANVLWELGTLGTLAVDNETNSLIGLTNNHVAINSAFFCSERNRNDLRENIVTDAVYQNLEITGLTQSILANYQTKIIGYPKRYYPFTKLGYNYIDAAVITIDSGLDPSSNPYINNPLSMYQEGLTGATIPIPFATTAEINNLMSTNPLLYSAGRTTGAKGEGITKLKLYQFPAVGTISGYRNQHFSDTADFSDLIVFVAVENVGTPIPTGSTITGLCAYPIYPGDSGSALIADIGGVKKIVGLCFAGGTYTALACRIDRIVNMMNVSAWNGSAVNYSDITNIQSVLVDGQSADPYIDVLGVRYWQAGLV